MSSDRKRELTRIRLGESARLQAVERSEFKLKGRTELIIIWERERRPSGQRWNQRPAKEETAKSEVSKAGSHRAWQSSEIPMALLSDCLGAVRGAWVCWGPNLCSFSFFSLCIYFPISSLLWPILANTTMSKPGKWTVLVKLEAQVPEYFEQHWWGHLSSTPEASKELSAYFFLPIRLHLWNRTWLLKLHELVSIPKVL